MKKEDKRRRTVIANTSATKEKKIKGMKLSLIKAEKVSNFKSKTRSMKIQNEKADKTTFQNII